MRILVISESHGARQALKHLLEYEKYDRLIFLGNFCSDLESLPVAFQFPPIVVRGLRDPYHNKPIEVRTKIAGKIFHITNGYQLNIKKYGTDEIMDYALKRDIDCIIYGDDNNDYVKRVGKMLFVNPGSLGIEHNGIRTYAIITIENDKIGVEIKTHNISIDSL